MCGYQGQWLVFLPFVAAFLFGVSGIRLSNYTGRYPVGPGLVFVATFALIIAYTLLACTRGDPH